MQGAEELASSD
jgi:hypothetical protein